MATEENLGSDIFKIKVTNVIDPLNFQAQIGPDEKFCQFDRQEEALRHHCFRNQDVKAKIDELQIGKMVLAKSRTWNKWVRAAVSTVTHETEEVDVLCVDYGTTEYLNLEDMITEVPVSMQVAAWPHMAWQCQLTGVKPIASTWISRAVNLFGELVLAKELDCQVLGLELGKVVVDIIVENGEEVISVSDLLIREALARSVPQTGAQNGSDGGAKRKVPEFNLKALHRQISGTSEPEERSPGGEDYERAAFTRGLDRSDSFQWERSDTTIGASYKPNISHDIINTIQEEISQAQQAQGLIPPTEDATALPLPPPVETPPRRSEEPKHVNSASPANRNRKSSADRARKPVKGHDSPVGRTSRGRGSPLASSQEDTPPGSRDRSPWAGRSNAVNTTKKSDSIKSGPILSVFQKYGSKPTAKQLENEYEWQSDKFTRKFRIWFSSITEDNYFPKIEALGSFIYPEHSTLDGLPGPKELHLSLTVVVDHGVNKAKGFRDIALRIIETVREHVDFNKVISEVLWHQQSESVKVTKNPKLAERRRDFCIFLGRLYVCARQWDENRSQSIDLCVIHMLDKWAVFNKRKQHPRPDEIEDMYADCLCTLLSEVGIKFQQHHPVEIARIFEEMREKILSNNLAHAVREKLLSLLLSQTWGFSEPMVFQERMPPPREVDSKEVQCCVEMEEACIQAEEEVVPTRDTEVQVEIEDLENSLYTTATEETEDNVSMSGGDGDPYWQVKVLLHDLDMEDLLGTFKDNAIRDSTLEMDFSDLKELFQECGLRAGQIWEIKTYLTTKAKEDTFPQNTTKKKKVPTATLR